MSTYALQVGGETRMTFSANFAQASDPIRLEGDSTPYQVADARHLVKKAARLLIDWCDSQGGSNVGEDEEYEVVPVVTTDEAVAVGKRVGAAIARSVLADSDMGREWTGIDPQDADQFTDAGIEAGTAEWETAEEAAREEYESLVPKAQRVKIVYANGERADEYDTYEAAVAYLESRYPDAVIGHDGDLSDGGDRTLVWESEEDSEDDAGANAVCQIVGAE